MLRFEEVSTEDGTTTKALAPVAPLAPAAPAAPVAPVTPAPTPATTTSETTTPQELPRSNLRHKLLLKLQAGRSRRSRLKRPRRIATRRGS